MRVISLRNALFAAALIGWAGVTSAFPVGAQQGKMSTAKPTRTALTTLCKGAVSVRVLRVLDPYQDPDDYESLTVKPGAPKSRYVLVMLEMQNLLDEPIGLYWTASRMIDARGGGTPAVGQGSVDVFGARERRVVEIKFNPLETFGPPATLLLNVSIGPQPLFGAPASDAQKKAYTDSWSRLGRAHPQQMAEISLAPTRKTSPVSVKPQTRKP